MTKSALQVVVNAWNSQTVRAVKPRSWKWLENVSKVSLRRWEWTAEKAGSVKHAATTQSTMQDGCIQHRTVVSKQRTICELSRLETVGSWELRAHCRTAVYSTEQSSVTCDSWQWDCVMTVCYCGLLSCDFHTHQSMTWQTVGPQTVISCSHLCHEH